MTAIPIFHRTATPTRDNAPLMGIDHEFMRFLRLRRAPRQCSATGAQSPTPAVVEADAGRGVY